MLKPMNSLISKRSPIVSLLFVIIFISQLSACAIFTSGSKIVDQEALEIELEDLFMRQNNASSEVMMLTMDEPDAEEFEDLLEAEQQMREVCDPLNEYAVRELEQLSLGLMLQNRILDAMDDCDDATTQVESLINEDLTDHDDVPVIQND